MGIGVPDDGCEVTATPFAGGPGGNVTLIVLAPGPSGDVQVPGSCLTGGSCFLWGDICSCTRSEQQVAPDDIFKIVVGHHERNTRETSCQQ